MKELFFIVDCSGSTKQDDMSRVSQVNELLRSAINTCSGADAKISVICYSDDAELFWSSANGSIFYDIPDDRFHGRSNLGKAYDFINSKISGKVQLHDCIIALISDGEATDNYRKSLANLDRYHKAKRLAISISSIHTTTERHASEDDFLFLNGIKDSDYFAEKIKDQI